MPSSMINFNKKLTYTDCLLNRRDAKPIIPNAKIASVDGSGTSNVTLDISSILAPNIESVLLFPQPNDVPLNLEKLEVPMPTLPEKSAPEATVTGPPAAP